MKNTLTIIILIFLTTACHKQEYYQNNPNVPSTATPSLLLSNICVDVFNTYPLNPAYAARYLAYYERPTDYITYSWGSGDGFSAYSTLRQVQEMDKLAQVSGEINYQGLAKFFRAVLFAKLTETFGDVPYSEALNGVEGLDEPKYDSQEDIYVGLLDELEAANNLLSDANGPITGDIIFDGKASKWKKTVNAFRLRLLIHLSGKESNTRLNIKQQCQTILSDPAKYPLMASISDNAQITYNTTATDNYYPTFNNLSVKSLVSLEKGFANLLKERDDQRIYSFGDPIQGQTPNVISHYGGVDASLQLTAQQDSALTASKINRRFVENEVNEPHILIGYSEQEFIIAEMLARGWAAGPGTAKDHYNNGIRGSMLFYGIGGPSIDTYLNKPLVKYDPATYLNQIITQKYLAMFMQCDWEPFFEQRRTGIPEFSRLGDGTLNNHQIPKRWKYPTVEYDVNKTNVTDAITRQYNGTDDINQMMWLLQ